MRIQTDRALGRPWRVVAATVAIAALPLLSTQCAQAQRRDTAALAVPAGAISFLVVGDWGRMGSIEQRAVARSMGDIGKSLAISFVISTGDNFYPNGLRDTDDRQFRDSFDRVYSAASLQVPWQSVLGNHDYYGNPDAEVGLTAKSSRWRMPARYYSVKKAVADSVTAEFFFLDSSPFVFEERAVAPKAFAGADTVAQRIWLDSALAASTAQWKFIVQHHHVYSGGPRGTQPETQGFLVPRMVQYGVQALISGHEHHLEYLMPLALPPHYFISGAGSETRPATATTGTKFVSASLGFWAMSLTADSMLVQAVDSRGRVLYRSSIKR